MVDVGAKPITTRISVARGHVACAPATLELLHSGELKKGDALAVARIAGIAAAKKTPDLIPLCHPVAITAVNVNVEIVADGVDIEAQVSSADRTGIEMEALTCVAAAALNVIDMVKAVDRAAHITKIWVEKKEGGASGSWQRGESVSVIEKETMPAEPAAKMVTGTVGVVTVSDRAARGERVDETGPSICARVTEWGAEARHLTVSDEVTAVQDAVQELIAQGAWLVITTGGTGITSRDVTPQAVLPLLDLELDGVAQALRAAGADKAPGVLLSRGVAGVSGRTAIVTLPGSTGGVRDGLAVLSDLVVHLSQQLRDGDH